MRTNRDRLGTVILLTVALSLLVLPAANAYIDPASTSALFQGIVAGIAAGGMFMKLFWRKIKAMFHRGPTATESLEAHEATESLEAHEASTEAPVDQ